jgi:hypothetical protein
MQLKKWPDSDLEYLCAIRQLVSFISLFTHNTEKFDDCTDARSIYEKLVVEIREKYQLSSMEEFWHWCYITAAKQLDIYEEKLL